MHELTSYSDYVTGEPLSFWKSASGFEVEFILGDHTAIEAKAKSQIGKQDLRSLIALSEEKTMKRLLCVCLESRAREGEGIQIVPLQLFLRKLWEGQFKSLLLCFFESRSISASKPSLATIRLNEER